jgi:hypothetical protein
MFDVKRLLTDVFQPEAGEIVTVAVDLPRDGVADTPAWKARRAMAERWRGALVEMGETTGFTVNPLCEFRPRAPTTLICPPAAGWAATTWIFSRPSRARPWFSP